MWSENWNPLPQHVKPWSTTNWETESLCMNNDEVDVEFIRFYPFNIVVMLLFFLQQKIL